MLLITELPGNWQPTKLKQGSEHVMKDVANFGRVHYRRRVGRGRAAPYVLVSVFIHLIFGLHLIQYTLYT
jgi:hypothetical protein